MAAVGTKPVIYYQNWLLKKEGVNTWVNYWTVIRGKWLQFYERENINDKPGLRKTLELKKVTQCALVKKKKKRYPFSIDNGVGTYYLKCELEIERYYWIFSILTAALGNPKRDLPKSIPNDMLEKTAFQKYSKRENSRPQSSPTKTRTKTPDEFNSRRRQRFAIRNENRSKRKEAKRAKKLGLEPNKSDNSSSENSPTKEDIRKKEIDELKRTKKLYFETDDNLRRFNSMEVLKDYPLPAKKERVKKTSVGQNMPEKQNRILTVQAMVHPPSRNGFMEHSSSQDEIVSIGINHAYEHDDIEELPTIPVTLDDEQVLPNMVLTNFSDDSDTDTLSTTETSLNSDTASFLSLSCNDISERLSYNRSRNDGVMSRTYFSKNDDMSYEQHAPDGSIRASPHISKDRSVLNNKKSSLLIPNTTGTLLQKNNRGILDRPISPMHVKPITPVKSPKDFSRNLVKS